MRMTIIPAKTKAKAIRLTISNKEIEELLNFDIDMAEIYSGLAQLEKYLPCLLDVNCSWNSHYTKSEDWNSGDRGASIKNQRGDILAVYTTDNKGKLLRSPLSILYLCGDSKFSLCCNILYRGDKGGGEMWAENLFDLPCHMDIPLLKIAIKKVAEEIIDNLKMNFSGKSFSIEELPCTVSLP